MFDYRIFSAVPFTNQRVAGHGLPFSPNGLPHFAVLGQVAQTLSADPVIAVLRIVARNATLIELSADVPKNLNHPI